MRNVPNFERFNSTKFWKNSSKIQGSPLFLINCCFSHFFSFQHFYRIGIGNKKQISLKLNQNDGQQTQKQNSGRKP